MKKLLFLLLFSILSFSQEKAFTVAQIDSICSVNENYGFKIGHFVMENDKKENIGKGHYEIKTFIYPKNDNTFNYKPTSDDVIKEIKNNKLIKAIYVSNIFQTNLEESSIYCELYYSKSELFYVKISLLKSIPNKDTITENFEFKIDKKSKIKNVKNILGYNLNDIIYNFNTEILDFNN